MVFNRVGIGEKAALAVLILDHEATAGRAELALTLPWQGVIGFSMYAVHLDHSIKGLALSNTHNL